MNRIKYLLTGILTILISIGVSSCTKKENHSLHIAVEFVDHAASAYIAEHMGWYEAEGLKIKKFDYYITGMALASALTRGDIDAAYICMIPAISAYANGGVKIKVVCGTHKYGYGLIVNTDKIQNISDLLKPGIRIAAPREGSPPDIIMNKMIDTFHMDRAKLKSRILRMPPPQVLLFLETGQIDAGFCCEQFPTMGERMGFKELINSKTLWPNMQGSVLIVKESLIKNNPELVRKLVRVTQKGIDYINRYPDKASVIVANALSIAGKKILPVKVGKLAEKLEIKPEDIKNSLGKKLINTSDIDYKSIQTEIDYMAKLSYIQKPFRAEEIVDLSFLK